MTWEVASVAIAALAAFTVLGVFALPYVRKRSDDETRIAALEAANVALTDRLARVEQNQDSLSPLSRLPRAGVSR